jgi:alkaline phosphatase
VSPSSLQFRTIIVCQTAALLGCAQQDKVVGPEDKTPAATESSAQASAVAPAVLVAAGDIAKCYISNQAGLTAKLLDRIPGTVAALGDNAYQDGTAAQYAKCYGPTWGRYKSRTRPALGNHEYNVSPNPYFDYFNGAGKSSGRAGPRGKGYYSYSLGAWHVVVLNSVTNIRQDVSSPQAKWLKADLAAHRTQCTLAYWHHPFFTSGKNRPATRMAPLVKILYDAGAEIVMSGHNHQYERFAPQDPSRRADSKRGLRAFVVGTGGAGMYGFERTQPNSQVRYAGGHGVLKLTLSPGSYTWEFVPVAGTSFRDSGKGTCH